MKKTIAAILILTIIAVLLAGCAAREPEKTFTHGLYEVGYATAVAQTEGGKPAVKITFPYYRLDGKKIEVASNFGLIFGDGGLYGMYLKVDGLAYPLPSVSVDYQNGKGTATSLVEVQSVRADSSLEVCYAGMDAYVERSGNRFYYAPYRLAQPAEHGSAQLVIDFSFVNGMDAVRKNDFISGPCPNLAEALNMAMSQGPFKVSVGGVEYEVSSLSLNVMDAGNGKSQAARAMLIVNIPRDTPVDAAVTVS